MSPQDIFDITTFLGKLSVLGLALLNLVVLWCAYQFEWIVPGRSHRRALEQSAANFKLADDATTQFERSLDLIERMQDRRRQTDGRVGSGDERS